MKVPEETETRDIVLLWARYSGSLTSTGHYPEGDSYVVGQEQLFNMVASTSVAITLGHDNASAQGYHSAYPLRENFYKKPPIQNKGPGGQLSFFLALMERYPGRLYQIGQKTGAIDAAALVGIPTLYIEDKDSPASSRMENWTKKVPFFCRAQIEEPPTVLGKAMRSIDREIKELRDYRVEQVLPSSPQKDPITSMPRDQWRRIAVLYQGLIEPFSAAKGQKSDPVTITNACFTANQATLDKWDEQIKALTPEQLKESTKTRLFPGYSQKDLEVIKKSLLVFVKVIRKTGSIIRNQEGKYVPRS